MKKTFIITSIFILFCWSQTYATWYKEPGYGFKINVPASWSSNSYQDGTDKVYDFYSPDQNIAIQLRAFESGGQVTTDLLIQVYEENMLPAGTRREGLFDKVSKNGIPGKQGVYSSKYNGQDVSMSAFYAVPNNYGYVLLVIIPTNMANAKTQQEIQSVTKTFFVDGFQAQSSAIQQTKPQTSIQSGLQGLSGSSTGNSGVSSANVKGVYEFYHRSDRKNLVNYHYIYINDDGTFREEYQPKNSGNYVGKNEGTWRKSGNQIILTHSGGVVKDTYNIESDGFLLKRTTSDGITFTFGQK